MTRISGTGPSGVAGIAAPSWPEAEPELLTPEADSYEVFVAAPPAAPVVAVDPAVRRAILVHIARLTVG